MVKMMSYIALILGLVVAAGCSRPPDGKAQEAVETRKQAETTPTQATSLTPAAPDVRTTTSYAWDPTQSEGNGEVEVKLSEFKIEMPASASAGTTIFKVTNAGRDSHSFEVEGNGIEREIEPDLKAGETKTLEVDLKPGTYTVYCPVEGHRKLGMSRSLTVR